MTLRLHLRALRYRIACRISPDVRSADELRHSLAIAEADASHAHVQARMATTRIEATEKQLEVAQTTTRNAVTRATELQVKYEDALQREAKASEDHIRTLKTVANQLLIASRSTRMFDDAGPTVPVPKETDPVAPYSSKQRARQVVNRASSAFLRTYYESMNKPIDDTVPATEPTTEPAAAASV